MLAALTQQTTDAVLMIRPCQFGWNGQTAVSNTYQAIPTAPPDAVQQQALHQFEALRSALLQAGVAVHVFDDLPTPHTPDALFPNNWFSTHEDGTLVLYPMATANRRVERRPHLIAALRRDFGFDRVLDLTHFEQAGQFLEGTGSLVLDRRHRIAYAAQSLRTHAVVLDAFARELGYRPILFATHEQRGQPVYHTNVLMSVGSTLAVVCLQAIAEARARDLLRTTLRESGREILEISTDQLMEFAGNLLELRDRRGAPLWVMSSRAHAALRPDQRELLAQHGALLHVPLATIESVGGGGARCMLAELFLPRNKDQTGYAAPHGHRTDP